MSDYTAITFDLSDHVAHITISRPEAANSLNRELATDLMMAALRCHQDAEIRAVVITGEGRLFCAGGDLKTFSAAPDISDYILETTTYLHAAMSRFSRMDAPLIAAVNGAAAGAGMSIACASDLVLAGESARFTMAYTNAGLTPDGSSTYFLPRIVGLRRALELTLTNRVLTAEEAADWGIVTRVVPDDELLAEAATLATELAQGPTGAFGATKRLLHSGWRESLETQMEHESVAIARAASAPEGREGVAAFLEKRPPDFLKP